MIPTAQVLSEVLSDETFLSPLLGQICLRQNPSRESFLLHKIIQFVFEHDESLFGCATKFSPSIRKRDCGHKKNDRKDILRETKDFFFKMRQGIYHAKEQTSAHTSCYHHAQNK